MSGLWLFIRMLPQMIDMMSRIGVLFQKFQMQQYLAETEVRIDALEKAHSGPETLAENRLLFMLMLGVTPVQPPPATPSPSDSVHV